MKFNKNKRNVPVQPRNYLIDFYKMLLPRGSTGRNVGFERGMRSPEASQMFIDLAQEKRERRQWRNLHEKECREYGASRLGR